MEVPTDGFSNAALLRACGRSRVYQATRDDGEAVILRVVEADDALQTLLVDEHERLRALGEPGLHLPRQIERREQQLRLIYRPSTGVRLSEFCAGATLAVDTFLPIARRLAEMVAQLHSCRVIHRGLWPGNVWVNAEGGDLSFADFGLIAALEQERLDLDDPAVVAEVAPYLAPEQTGRTHRPIDARTDLYGLGALYYQLLTATAPFSGDGETLLRALLVEAPEAPSARHDQLPELLSALVMKLLDKRPGHRYQRATSLLEDLSRLKQLLDHGGRDSRAFVLADADHRSETGCNSDAWARIHGRERERVLLTSELERVVNSGKPRVLLISGPVGSGKSTLDELLVDEVLRRGGLLGRGRVDSLRSPLPYTAWLEALDDVLGQLSGEPQARRQRWRERLCAQLGTLAPVLCELLPNLAPLLSASTEAGARLCHLLPELASREAQNRLRLAFSRLLAALGEDQPLVLRFDDFHGADDGSLDLLAALLEGGEFGRVLLIANYRGDELYDEHRLLELAAHLRGRGVGGRCLELAPLSDVGVAQTLREVLTWTDEDFLHLVVRKTGGNPLFLRIYVEALVGAGLLATDGDGGWRWDEDAITEADLPGSLSGLLAARLAALPKADAALLRRAACLGPRFDLRELAAAVDRPCAAILPGLQRLCDDGMLVDLGLSFAFASDGMREHANAEVDTRARHEVHRRLGVLGLSGPLTGARLFDVAERIDAGDDANAELEDDARRQIIALDLRAGQRALELASYSPALRCLEHAAMLLRAEARALSRGEAPADATTIFEVFFARAQALALAGRRQQADVAFDQLLSWPISLSEYGRVAACRIRMLVLVERSREAVDLGLTALRRCGYSLTNPTRLRVMLTLLRAWLGARRRSNDEILAMAPLTEGAAATAMDIITALTPVVYTVDVKLFLLLTAVHARLVLDHGRHRSASAAIGQLAMAAGPVLRRPHQAARLADCALALAGDDQPAQVRAEVIGLLFVWHQTRPLSQLAAEIEPTYRRTLEVGDFEFAGYLAALGVNMQLEIGTDLQALIERSQAYEREIGSWGSASLRTLLRVQGSLAAALVGDIDAGLGEVDASRRSLRVVPVDPASTADGPKLWFYSASVIRALFHLIMDEAALALAMLDAVADYPRVMLGSWSVPRAAMIHALAAAQCHAGADDRERRRLSALIDRSVRLLRRWARNSPENYGHLLALVLAEREVLLGNYVRAFGLFEQARDQAEARGCAYASALACERMAAHMAARGMVTLATGPSRRAWEIYRRWGARAKQQALAQAHGFGERSLPGGFESTAGSDDTAVPLPGKATIDLEAVTSALSAIAEELDFDAVVRKALEAAMSNAGADRGALLIEGKTGLELVALGGASRRVQNLSPPLELSSAAAMVPLSFVAHMLGTGKTLVVDDARVDPRFARDAYVERTGVRSLLCMPLGKQQRRLGALVLENRQRVACFGDERLQLLSLVATQASGAIDNANLYRALRRSEVQWRSLVDGAPDLIALLDTNGELTFVNRVLPGWRVGLPPAIEPASAGAWRLAIEAALEHGRRGEVEIAVQRAAGGLRWYDAHIAPVEIEDEPRRVMIIATEITERKRADARRLELEAALRQQQRLESIGTLASGVAHEINNPVQGILNYAELLGLSSEEPAMVVEFAGEIATEAERVATIVRNLLAFSRRDGAPECAPTAMAEIVQSTLSLIHSTLRRDQIDLALEVPETLPLVPCHVQQIQQILMNLVTNARDALNERWQGHHPDKQIRIQAELIDREQRRWVRLSVIDRGAGIPESVRAHIFDPFFTTKGRDQGTGLGLSVSHGIARDHGGELWAESEVGVGTKFHLELPAA